MGGTDTHFGAWHAGPATKYTVCLNSHALRSQALSCGGVLTMSAVTSKWYRNCVETAVAKITIQKQQQNHKYHIRQH